MTANVITLGRLLTRLGDQDKNFQANLRKLTFTDVYKGGKSITTGEPQEKSIEAFRATLQSVKDQIADHAHKRNLLNKANLETKVTILGTEYTIAEVLVIKAYTIPQKKLLMAELERQFQAIRQVYLAENRSYEALIKDRDPKDLAELEKMFGPSVFNILDPLKELSAEIEAWESEVNAALTEINSITQIDLG